MKREVLLCGFHVYLLPFLPERWLGKWSLALSASVLEKGEERGACGHTPSEPFYGVGRDAPVTTLEVLKCRDSDRHPVSNKPMS